jgi:hypothetical protein
MCCKEGHRHNNPRPTVRWFDPANTKRIRGNRPKARNALPLRCIALQNLSPVTRKATLHVQAAD